LYRTKQPVNTERNSNIQSCRTRVLDLDSSPVSWRLRLGLDS